MIPNFKVKNHSQGTVTIRDFLRDFLMRDITFFILKNSSSQTKGDKQVIFSGKIPLDILPNQTLLFSVSEGNGDIVFQESEEVNEELSKIDCLIIRPDFIIEKIILL